MDFQISRLVSMARKDVAEIGWHQQEDAMLMRPNLSLDDMEDEGFASDDGEEMDQRTKDMIKRKVDRAMESGYDQMEKANKQSFMKAIREKREKLNKETKREDNFKSFQKRRLLDSSLVRDMENELEQRPYETEKRPNIAGVYDPMQEERIKTDLKQWTKTVMTKEQKKVVNKRINRLKQNQKVDDFTEIEQFGKMMSREQGGEAEVESSKKKLSKGELYKQKKRGGWQANTDEEKYDSKRQAKLRRSGKIKGKKKGK